MQENVQGPVTLAGPGYVYRPNDKYQPGEYKRLLNIDINNEGSLVNRPPVQGYLHNPEIPLFRAIGTLGSNGSNAVATGASAIGEGVNDLFYFGEGTNEQYWGLTYSNFVTYLVPKLDEATSSIAGDRSSKEAQFEGVFKYNGKFYLIVYYTFNIVATNTKYGCLLVLNAPDGGGDAASVPPADYFVYTGSVISTDSWSNTDLSFMNTKRPKFKVRNFVVSRERLWFASGDTVYFSAATTPDNFAVPSGGFFKFDSMNIKKVLAVGDLIYVFGDSSIRVIQYSTDPNTDAQVTLISDVIGAEDAVVFGDSVYSVKPGALYEIRGLNVSKAMDLKIDLVRSDDNPVAPRGDSSIHPEDAWAFDLKLAAFNDSLYVIPRFVYYFVGMTNLTAHPYKVYYGPQNLAGLINTALEPQVGMYHINMDNGSISQYEFGSNGVPFDCVYVPIEDRFNQTRLLMLGSNSVGWRAFAFGTRLRFHSSLTSGYYEGVDDFCMDVCGNNGLELSYEIPIFLLWIRHFSPDSLRNVVKKFRRVTLEANLPTYWDVASVKYKALFKLSVWAGLAQTVLVGDTKADTTTSILNEVAIPSVGNDGPGISASYAYGSNQRARQVDLIIGNYNYEDPSVGSRYGLYAPPVYTQAQISALSAANNLIPVIQAPCFEISDLRTFWTYTGRGTTGTDDKS